MLAQLLHLAGIDSIVLERGSEEHVIQRVRAGVLEQGTVDLMHEAGVGARLAREGLRHGGIYVAFDQQRHHLDFERLTGGRAITIYGQNEVVRDLIDARLGDRPPAAASTSTDVELARPHDADAAAAVHRRRRPPHEIRATSSPAATAFTASSRPSIPPAHAQAFERAYPFGWLGILAEAPPSSNELVYSLHERGFALFSMRSPTLTRLYLQVRPGRGHRRLVRRRGSGRSCTRGWRRATAGDRTKGRLRRRASRRCAASCASRCSAAICSLPATPRTSCRRPAPRG